MTRVLIITLAVLWLCLAAYVAWQWPGLSGVEYPGD